MKRFIIGVLVGLCVPAAYSAININIENIYLRDVAAIAFCAAESSSKGWSKNLPIDSYNKADMLLAARGKR